MPKLITESQVESACLEMLEEFGTFSRCHDLLRQEPKQAESRDEIKELLKVSSGGIIFTTIQKFLPQEKGKKYPLLSERKNIIVIADEAHRSQYDFIDGFAKNIRDALPNASFIGFTGTPIEKADRNTRAIFGKDVDVYDVQQAVEDEVTVRIFYESRLAKLELKPEERPHIDKDFEEVTEGEEVERKEKLKSKWARLEKAIKAYTNKSIETAEVIEQLIDLARKMRDEEKRGQKLGLNENEIAFYDALVDHDGVREVMGDEKLMIIARELVENIRKSVTIDWTMRENVQAQMRVKVKQILKKYGYPPDKRQKATDTLLEQAKLLCKDWAENAA